MDSLCSDSDFPFSDPISNFLCFGMNSTFYFCCNFLADLYSLLPNSTGSYPRFPQIHLSLPSFCDGPVPFYFLSFSIASLCAEMESSAQYGFLAGLLITSAIFDMASTTAAYYYFFLRFLSASNCKG